MKITKQTAEATLKNARSSSVNAETFSFKEVLDDRKSALQDLLKTITSDVAKKKEVTVILIG